MAVYKKCLIGSMILAPIITALIMGIVIGGVMLMNWIEKLFPLFPFLLTGLFVGVVLVLVGYVLYEFCVEHHKKKSIKEIITHG